ncbi:MAG: queuosine precursor transporter [Cytophagales bacterium]|nr:queuosine precursor transporter [Cytophagales bacterium]
MGIPNTINSFHKDKKTTLFLVLSGIFLTNAIIAEIIGVKIFSLEKLLHAPPAQLDLLPGFVLDFNLTAGVIIWPFVFVTTDIINEYFGKDGVKRISYLAAGLIAYAFLVIYCTTHLPPADFWLAINNRTPDGQPFNIDFAFSTIFRQGLGIIIGSLTAFLVGQLVDVYTFHWLRGLTGNKKIWIRATGSTLVSQLIDSFVVLTVAFYLFGNWSLAQVISVGIINYIYKFGIAIAMTPVLYVAHAVIDKYLGIKQAENMEEEADKSYP